MKIVILGAGGLGSYLGAVLYRAGHEVFLVTRGEHAEAIQRKGLQIQSPEGDFEARPACVSSALEVAGADVLFVTVKAFSLDEVTPQVRGSAEQGSTVVPLLNGVDTTDRLRASGVAPEALVDGIAYFTAFRTAPGVIERKGVHQRLVIGSSDGRSETRLPGIEAAFDGTGVEVEEVDDIRAALWGKMAVVCSLAAICGITGSSIGPIRRHAFGKDLQERAIAEVFGVGRAEGVALPPDSEARVGEILDAFPDDFYPSVLHDLRSGRRTEMDALGGVISRLGRKLGVDTPLYDAATCAIQVMEDSQSSAGGTQGGREGRPARE